MLQVSEFVLHVVVIRLVTVFKKEMIEVAMSSV